jgi:hypothetical protein
MARAGPTPADVVLDQEDASLLDLLDNALNKGIVLTGDVTLGLARIDLIYARLSLLLCAADRVLPYTDRKRSGGRHRRRPAIRRMR